MQTTLLLVLFFCHWMADFTHLSTTWMLDAKRLGKPLLPILAHACIHGALMFLALTIICPVPFAQWLALIVFQIVSHFLIDVWKGRMNGWFPNLLNPANKFYWWLLGIDQYFHTVVIVLMVWWLFEN